MNEGKQTVDLPSDVIGVIAGFLPASIDALRPLMLVSNSWFRGVVEQDGMRPKPGVYWPWIALEHRKPRSVTVPATFAVVCQLRCYLPQLTELVITVPVKDAEVLSTMSSLAHLNSLELHHGCGHSLILILDALTDASRICADLISLKVKGFNVDDQDLEIISEHFPMLQTFEYDHFESEVTEVSLQNLIRNHPKLRTLRVAPCDTIPDLMAVVINAVAAHCPQLRSLHVEEMKTRRGHKRNRFRGHLSERSGRTSDAEAQLRSSLARLTSLTSLTITGAGNLVTDSVLAELIGTTTTLKTLDLTASNITNQTLMCLAAHAQQLQTLTVTQCESLTNEGLAAVASRCVLLSSFSVNRTPISETGILAIAEHQTKLTTLDLTFSDVSDTSLSCLADPRNPVAATLQVLRLDKFLSTTEALHISAMSNLKVLEICGCTNDKDFGILGTKLEHLNELVLVGALTSTRSSITDDGLVCFTTRHRLRNFTCLRIGCAKFVSDHGVECIANNLCRLTTLAICNDNHTKTITDAGVEHIMRKLPDLRSLELHGNAAITDNGVQLITQNLLSLVKLDIGGLQLLSDSGLDDVSRLRHLEMLCVDDCNGLSDDCMEEVAKLEKLCVFSHMQCRRITSRGRSVLLRVRPVELEF